MTPQTLDAACPYCSSQFRAIPKRSFLGFQKLVCPNCTRDVAYPLTSGYRTTYWVLFVLMIVSIIAAYSRGEIGIPGGFGIAVSVALIRDWQIRSRLRLNVASELHGPTSIGVASQRSTRTSARDEAVAPAALTVEAGSSTAIVPRENSSIRIASVNEPTEACWARALSEFEGSARRPGLWAQCFAEAGGNDARAKANYLAKRASELQLEHEIEAKRLAEVEAIRLAAQREYDAKPKGLCPSCENVILLNATECPRCNASFGEGAAWKVRPVRKAT